MCLNEYRFYSCIPSRSSIIDFRTVQLRRTHTRAFAPVFVDQEEQLLKWFVTLIEIPL
jgi:hypothetical protein